MSWEEASEGRVPIRMRALATNPPATEARMPLILLMIIVLS
jgi:hypothetical protein